MITMIIVMNTILEKEFRNDAPITPVKLNALIYLTQLSSIHSGEEPVLGHEQFIVGESFPVSASFSAKFAYLNLHKPITSYVTDAAGNKEVYTDSQLSRHISSASSLIRDLQDHQIITMMANPQTSWFQAKYHKEQPYPDYNGVLTQEDLRRDSELYFS